MTSPITENITVNMVKNFQIHENYAQVYPSTHVCKIILEDGRRVKKSMFGPEIYLLIQAIAKQKITFKRDPEFLSWEPQNINYFESYELDWKHLLPNKYLDHSSLPETILSLAFQKIV